MANENNSPRSRLALAKMYLVAIALIWLGLIVFVNPLREMALEDDWVYSGMVRHLLQTGHFVKPSTAAASLPFQTYWGALFCLFHGFSFSALRISTLALCLLGFIAFYRLARYQGFDSLEASLATLCFATNPLMIRFGFTFMTDVPLLMWLTVAMALFARGFRFKSAAWVFAASVASSAAILTRQFGIALPASLALAFLLSPKNRPPLPLLILGLALPALASFWQLYDGTFHPTWALNHMLFRNKAFLHPYALHHLPNRFIALLNYFALFAMPLGIACVMDVLSARERLRDKWLWISFGLVFTAMLALYAARRLTMPYTGPNFTLFVVGVGPLYPWRGVLTLATGLGAALFLRIFVKRFSLWTQWQQIPLFNKVLDLFLLIYILMLYLVYNFADEYMLPLVPVVILIIGHAVKQRWSGPLTRYLTVAVALVMAGLGGIEARGIMEFKEAMWKGGDLAVKYTGDVRRVYHASDHFAGYRYWRLFNSTFFDDLLAEGGYNADPTPEKAEWQYSPGGPYDQKEIAWATHSPYWVTNSPDPTRWLSAIVPQMRPTPAEFKWQVVETIPYRDFFLRRHHIYVMKRDELVRDRR